MLVVARSRTRICLLVSPSTAWLLCFPPSHESSGAKVDDFVEHENDYHNNPTVDRLGFKMFPSNGSRFNADDTSIAYLAHFEYAGYAAGAMEKSQDWLRKDIMAAQCALWACVKTFSTKITDSKQIHIVEHSWAKLDEGNAELWGDTIKAPGHSQAKRVYFLTGISISTPTRNLLLIFKSSHRAECSGYTLQYQCYAT